MISRFAALSSTIRMRAGLFIAAPQCVSTTANNTRFGEPLSRIVGLRCCGATIISRREGAPLSWLKGEPNDGENGDAIIHEGLLCGIGGPFADGTALITS